MTDLRDTADLLGGWAELDASEDLREAYVEALRCLRVELEVSKGRVVSILGTRSLMDSHEPSSEADLIKGVLADVRHALGYTEILLKQETE